MGSIIHNIIHLPRVFIELHTNLRKQNIFMKPNLAPLLAIAEDTNDGSLLKKDFQKINNYYGLAVPAILGEAFCTLRGIRMTGDERLASTIQGAITGLFDDFFDELKLPETRIVNMVNNADSIRPHTSNEKLFLELYKFALQKAAHPSLIIEQLMLVHKAQVASVEQENPNISNTRIWDITCLKGGESVLFYRTAFDNLFVAGEKEALFQLGSIMQFENDIFDIYKDFKNGIQTLPTTVTKANELRKLYVEQMELFIKLCYKMEFPNRQISHFLDGVMPVLNRGFVCLDRYQLLENNNNGFFDLKSFSRKQLICDMETIRNLLKTIKYQVVNHY